MELLNRETFLSLFQGINERKTLQIKHSGNTNFLTVRSIHLTAEPPYIILDDRKDTRINLSDVTDVQIK